MKTIGPAVSEKKIFEIVDDGRTDDGRTPEHGNKYYKLTYELKNNLRDIQNDRHNALPIRDFFS